MRCAIASGMLCAIYIMCAASRRSPESLPFRTFWPTGGSNQNGVVVHRSSVTLEVLPGTAALFLQFGESCQHFLTMLVRIDFGEYYGNLAFGIDDEGVTGSELHQAEVRQ